MKSASKLLQTAKISSLIIAFTMVKTKGAVALVVLLCLIGVLKITGAQESCSGGESFLFTNSQEEPSIYDELTTKEINNVLAFMYGQKRFGMSEGQATTDSRTYIYLMEISPPIKAEVLEYLDRRGPKPERFARVVLYRGDQEPPVIEEYRVGPLPDPKQLGLITPPGRKNPIPFSSRRPASQIEGFKNFLGQQMTLLDPIMLDIVGYTFNNCSSNCLTFMFGLPGDYSGRRVITVIMVRDIEGSYLHPVGLELQVQSEATDWRQWNLELVWFRGRTYGTAVEMLEAYSPGSTFWEQEAKKKVLYEDDEQLHSSLNFRGEPRPTKPLRGPAAYYPDGKRYEVDGHHVKWQGWSFDFTTPSVTGLSLYDVRFLGERIIYEMSPQEISVRYSGRSPWGQYTAYHDTLVNMGRDSYQLFPGVDCPKFADYFSFTHYLDGVAFKFENSACLFELDRGIPLRRHYESDHKGSYKFYHGMPDNVLVLRSMVIAWNYDYILDYIFHQQGGIEVVASLSGYILSTFYTGAQDDPYGFETSPHTLGNIHHHLLHFKVDFDIQGSENRFETLDIKVEEEPELYADGTNFLYKYERHLRETEQEAAYKFNFETPKYLLFYNENSKNKFGNPRSYRLAPMDMSKWLVPPESAMEKSFSWARYQVAVTKHKMDEYFSSSMYNTMSLTEPVMNFQDFIDDDENIVDEDLVAWVTLGTIHIPHTEDIPIVLTQGVQLTFHILPYNYFDEDVSLSSRDNVRVTPGRDGTQVYKYSGLGHDNTCSGATYQLGIDLVICLVLSIVYGLETFH